MKQQNDMTPHWTKEEEKKSLLFPVSSPPWSRTFLYICEHWNILGTGEQSIDSCPPSDTIRVIVTRPPVSRSDVTCMFLSCTHRDNVSIFYTTCMHPWRTEWRAFLRVQVRESHALQTPATNHVVYDYIHHLVAISDCINQIWNCCKQMTSLFIRLTH